MKVKSDSLVRFIEDFKLEGQNDIICFDAVVTYVTAKKQLQLPSEIQIIHLAIKEWMLFTYCTLMC